MNDNISMGRMRSDDPAPRDFDKFLPWACFELAVEAEIIITRGVPKQQTIDVATERSRIKKLTPKKASITDSSLKVDAVYETVSEFTGNMLDSSHRVMIESFYDLNENLVQLKFLNNKTIPRRLMKIIGLVIPLLKYLTSITINSGLRKDSMYEISKFLPISQITEICLDGTFLIEANYHILLMDSPLKHLSLAKCKINDTVVETIASKLEYPCPASKTLSALNLSTNIITDSGAIYLADALRTNRQLSYLNLADNMITDRGGMSILDILKKFPLTEPELLNSRTRFVAYLKNKNSLISALVKDFQKGDFEKKPKKKVIKSGTNLLAKKHKGLEKELSVPLVNATLDADLLAQQLRERAEVLAEIKLGPFKDPFSPNNTEKQDGVIYCLGNNSLCYLNLAYNDLTYASVKKLYEVLLTQKDLNRTPRGLINVVIEGNFIPVACTELQEIDDLIRSGLDTIKEKIPDVVTKKKYANKASTK